MRRLIAPVAVILIGLLAGARDHEMRDPGREGISVTQRVPYVLDNRQP